MGLAGEGAGQGGPKGMRWRRWLMPIRLIVSSSLLAYLIWQANPESIWDAWRQVDFVLLGLALLVQFVGVAVSAAKWGMLLQARGQGQPYAWLLGVYLAGQFANNFLPTTIGGDALRIAQLGRRINSYSQSSASVFLDRLTGFLVLSLIANLVLLLNYAGVPGATFTTEPWLQLLTAAFGLAAIGALAGSFAAARLQQVFGSRFLPRFARQPIEHLAEAIAIYSPRGWALVQIMVMSLLFQSIWIAVNILCGLALGISAAPLLLYALMVPVTDILGLAPIFVNNLGAREAVFVLYLSQVGVDSATAIALAFLVFSVRLVVSILGGVVVLFGGADLDTRRVQEAG